MHEVKELRALNTDEAGLECLPHLWVCDPELLIGEPHLLHL